MDKFRDIFKKGIRSENYFMLGLDIGLSASAISQFDLNRNTPEIIDISGGYGKPSMPTAILFSEDTREWVFGEYAVTGGPAFFSMVEKLGLNDYIEAGGRSFSVTGMLGLYIKELIGNCKNINPRAEIIGIVVSVPEYLDEEARKELRLAFKLAGFEKSPLTLSDSDECILQRHYFEKTVQKSGRKTVLIVDYGASSARASVYDVAFGRDNDENIADCLSFAHEKSIGTNVLENKVAEFLENIYHNCTKTDSNRLSQSTEERQRIKEQLQIFTYQYKDLLFQKGIRTKPVKLYFNFTYPPVQGFASNDEVSRLIKPFIEKMRLFLKDTVSKSGKSLKDVDEVICAGGGFEMLWAKETVLSLFPKTRFYKNSKMVAAEGASIISANELNVITAAKFDIRDKCRVNCDIGFKITKNGQERFFAFIEQDTAWWLNHPAKLFILNEPVRANNPVFIEVLKRDSDGGVDLLAKLRLDGLPERPRGTTRLSVKLGFPKMGILKTVIQDLGFGEIFPASGLEREFVLNLEEAL